MLALVPSKARDFWQPEIAHAQVMIERIDGCVGEWGSSN